MTEKDNEEKVFSQTKQIAYGGSVTRYDTWTVDGSYSSFSEIQKDYEAAITVKGYSDVTTIVTSYKSGGVIYVQYTIVGLS